jgi:hypothetical protein
MTAEEAILAARIRGEIIRQDLARDDVKIKHKEREERLAQRRRRDFVAAALQFSALFGGGALVFLQHEWIGGFAIAAALYGVAREFVMQKFPGPASRPRPEADDEEDHE